MLTPAQAPIVRDLALEVLRDGTLRLNDVATWITVRLRERKAGFEVGASEVRDALATDARFEVVDAPSGKPDTMKWARLAKNPAG